MAKTRERACRYYICEGQCKKGRKGDFDGTCQHCDKYNPLPGSRKFIKKIVQNRKNKMDKIMKRERRDY